jgi:DNA-binding response OmpR family regulator
MKVLLVDDESGILDALKILFRGEGYDVRVASSGKEAMGAL